MSGSSTANGRLLFQWGTPSCTTNADRTYFNSFTLNGVEYAVGDHVLLYPEQAGLPHFVGRLKAAFASADHAADPHQVEVSWLERRIHVDPSAKGSSHVDQEVVELEETDVNPIGCISGKCTVLKASSWEEALHASKGVSGEWFFCRGLWRSSRLIPYGGGAEQQPTGRPVRAVKRAPVALPSSSEDEDSSASKRSRTNEGASSTDVTRASAAAGAESLRPSKAQPSVRMCVECGATQTPQWREGPQGPKTLCNACGVRYVRAQQRANKRATAQGIQRPAQVPVPPAKAVAATTRQPTPANNNSNNNASKPMKASGSPAPTASPTPPAIGRGARTAAAAAAAATTTATAGAVPAPRPMRKAALAAASRTAELTRNGDLPVRSRGGRDSHAAHAHHYQQAHAATAASAVLGSGPGTAAALKHEPPAASAAHCAPAAATAAAAGANSGPLAPPAGMAAGGAAVGPAEGLGAAALVRGAASASGFLCVPSGLSGPTAPAAGVAGADGAFAQATPGLADKAAEAAARELAPGCSGSMLQQHQQLGMAAMGAPGGGLGSDSPVAPMSAADDADAADDDDEELVKHVMGRGLPGPAHSGLPAYFSLHDEADTDAMMHDAAAAGGLAASSGRVTPTPMAMSGGPHHHDADEGVFGGASMGPMGQDLDDDPLDFSGFQPLSARSGAFCADFGAPVPAAAGGAAAHHAGGYDPTAPLTLLHCAYDQQQQQLVAAAGAGAHLPAAYPISPLMGAAAAANPFLHTAADAPVAAAAASSSAAGMARPVGVSLAAAPALPPHAASYPPLRALSSGPDAAAAAAAANPAVHMPVMSPLSVELGVGGGPCASSGLPGSMLGGSGMFGADGLLDLSDTALFGMDTSDLIAVHS